MTDELLRAILEELRFQGRVLQKINENLIRQANPPCGEKRHNAEMMRSLQVVADMFKNTPIGAQMEAALKAHAEDR